MTYIILSVLLYLVESNRLQSLLLLLPFDYGETEAQRSQLTCQRSHSYWGAEPRFEDTAAEHEASVIFPPLHCNRKAKDFCWHFLKYFSPKHSPLLIGFLNMKFKRLLSYGSPQSFSRTFIHSTSSYWVCQILGCWGHSGEAETRPLPSWSLYSRQQRQNTNKYPKSFQITANTVTEVNNVTWRVGTGRGGCSGGVDHRRFFWAEGQQM